MLNSEVSEIDNNLIPKIKADMNCCNAASCSLKYLRSVFVSSLLCIALSLSSVSYAYALPPAPLLKDGTPVAWWFVFKLNTAAFPNCSGEEQRVCPFGGQVQPYKFSQQYVYASNENHMLQKGGGCLGDTESDPVGSTFNEVYNGSYYYVIWNDQFYDDPPIQGCTKECGSPWGHSKGMLVWDDSGSGFVMQVSTPSWPASGSRKFPRMLDGNTLGCVLDDDVKVSQHFFALKLTKEDVVKVLKALSNASVVTDPANAQIVNNGGPTDIQQMVAGLGKKTSSTTYLEEKLSSGVELISKPSHLHVPPWQMVSSILGSVPLRTATWWAKPKIASTSDTTEIACWDEHLAKPGAVEIATTGQWDGIDFGLTGGGGPNFNHAKLGVSTAGEHHYAIFGDMNQQGTLSGENCGSSQNGRGGLFYVIDDSTLATSIGSLINGETAPVGQ